MTADVERRAPVQGTWGRGGYLIRPGTIAWSEHMEAWEIYAARHGRDQSAERIAERHGFSYEELKLFLGRCPTTWREYP